eukprot:3780546-Pleurochrysis_carterae.AAC.1
MISPAWRCRTRCPHHRGASTCANRASPHARRGGRARGGRDARPRARAANGARAAEPGAARRAGEGR